MAAKRSNKEAALIIKAWFAVAACMVFIFFISSRSQRDIPPFFPFQDVVYHTLVYLILALYFSRALKNTNPNIPALNLIIFTIIFGVVYGISDEFHQSFIPGRSVSGFDVFIDGIGSTAGGIIYLWPK